MTGYFHSSEIVGSRRGQFHLDSMDLVSGSNAYVLKNVLTKIYCRNFVLMIRMIELPFWTLIYQCDVLNVFSIDIVQFHISLYGFTIYS